MALVLTAAISFSSAITALAADTETNISLDDRAKFTVTLQSNSLVFNNEPTDQTYDSISLDILDSKTSALVRNITYNRGQGNGAILSVAGIPDGSYMVRVGYVTNGFKQYRDKYAYTLEVKSGVASFKANNFYANNLKMTANERTDASALASYKGTPKAVYIKQANLITAGITNDFDKVKAIHDWVATNMYYDYWDGKTPLVDKAAANAELIPGTGVLKRGICGNFAGVTMELMRAAGFPAKIVGGNVISDNAGHDWNEVFVDGRWVFMDTTFDCINTFDGTFSNQAKCKQTYFDTPMAEWSLLSSFDGVVNIGASFK